MRNWDWKWVIWSCSWHEQIFIHVTWLWWVCWLCSFSWLNPMIKWLLIDTWLWCRVVMGPFSWMTRLVLQGIEKTAVPNINSLGVWGGESNQSRCWLCLLWFCCVLWWYIGGGSSWLCCCGESHMVNLTVSKNGILIKFSFGLKSACGCPNPTVKSGSLKTWNP